MIAIHQDNFPHESDKKIRLQPPVGNLIKALRKQTIILEF